VQIFDHDVVIVGAGSAGYAAARTVGDFGCSAALVDHGPLGGLCILRGCMPSKAFLASSDEAQDTRESSALGVHVGGVSVDMPFVAQRKRDLVKEFADYRIEGIAKFPLYGGRAQFISGNELQVGDDAILRAEKFIIATGSIIQPALVPGLADTGYIDTDSALELEHVPESVIVLGGGFTACELGQFFSRMGAKTTMLIRSGHLLTDLDDDVGDALMTYYREEGIEVITRTTLIRASKRDGKKVVTYALDGVEHEAVADEIFFALGRIPNVDSLGLEKAGVAFDEWSGIGVDASLRTSNPKIFAIGDVTGKYMLVHVAIYQGEIAARNACQNASEAADYSLAAAYTVFSDPQVAGVGASEKDLQKSNTPYVSGRYDFAEHGKAMCLNKTKGFVKMMAEPVTGRILGACVVGPQGSELIHEVIVAMNYRATAEQFMRIPHLHPTLAEIWTYPAEECASRCGQRRPGDEAIEVATNAAPR